MFLAVSVLLLVPGKIAVQTFWFGFQFGSWAGPMCVCVRAPHASGNATVLLWLFLVPSGPTSQHHLRSFCLVSVLDEETGF